MKKSFSLLLAVGMAASAFAFPQKEVKRVSTLIGETKRVIQTSEKQSFNLLPEQAAFVANAKMYNSQAAQTIVAEAPAEATIISFNEKAGKDTLFYYESYSPWSGGWSVIFSDGSDDPANCIRLLIADNAKELRGVYTTKNLNAAQSNVSVMIDKDSTLKSTIDSMYLSFTPVRKGYQIEGKFFVNNSAVCVTLSHLKEQLMPKDTVDIAIPMAEIDNLTDSTWQIKGATEDNKYMASALVKSTRILGGYSAAQLDSMNSYVTIVADNDTIRNMQQTAALTSKYKSKNYLIDYTMIGTDTVLYNVHFTSPVPAVKDTVELVAHNLKIDGSLIEWGMNTVMISASTNEFNMSIWLTSDSLPNDNYAVEKFQSSFLAFGEKKIIGFMDGTVNISAKDTTITGYLLGEDIVCYHLNLNFEFPKAKDTVRFDFGEEVLPLNFEQSYMGGEYWVRCKQGKYDSQLDFYADEKSPVGSYSMLAKQMSSLYNFIGIINPTDTVMIGALDANMTVEKTKVDTIFAVTANLLGEDTIAYVFTFKASYNYVEGSLPYDTKSGDLAKTYTQNDIVGFSGEDYDYDGSIYFYAAGMDDARYTELTFFAEDIVVKGDTMPAAGVYTIDYSEKKGTVLASKGVESDKLTGSFSGFLTQEGISGMGLYFLVSGTVTVSYNENQQIKVVIAAKNSNGLNVDIVYDAAATAIGNVDTDAAQPVKVLRNGQVLIFRDGKYFNTVGQIVE